MEESNREELIRVIKDEQEITKDYFINVAQVRGLINLGLNDFRKFADKLKPIMEVIVDARISVSAQIETAMEEIRKQQTTVVSAIILSVSFKPSYSLMMEELEGIQERAYISNQRSVSLFVFV